MAAVIGIWREIERTVIKLSTEQKTANEETTASMRPMIVLSGPTAVGKTKLSIALAKAVGGEIISADSMQVYRHMDIGSAKITREEMQGVPHHMIDVLEPWEEFSVAVFKEMCEQCLSGIYERGHIPIITGGTGFYVQALLRDIDFLDENFVPQSAFPAILSWSKDSLPIKDARKKEKTDIPDIMNNQNTDNHDIHENRNIRTFLEQTAEEKGPAYLHELLKQADPLSAELIHANNIKRTIRALEYFYLTGEPISSHNKREREKPSAYLSCYFVLNDLRERIYEKIEQRVDGMLRQGLVTEVEKLRQMGCHRGMTSMQGLGYKEILTYLEGETTLEEAVKLIKRDTRHFAKRQLTWFRREKEVIWVNKNEFDYDEDRILEFMIDKLRENGILPRKEQSDFVPSIYLFSGPCGCGKTTLTNAWAKKLVNEGKRKQIYVIHGDDFHAGFVEPDFKDAFFEDGQPVDILEWEEILKFNWECILDTAGRVLARGLDVAVDYVVEDELPLMRQLAETYQAKLYYVVLTAEEETIRQRIAGRGDVEMTERALFLKNKLDHMAENQGHLFDTTQKTAEQELTEMNMESFLLQREIKGGDTAQGES
ncbi:MAG TPA: tRNA (adenosine(37)-N6)-dimethylallyltransferase MiaA [Lachnospiraceae bacterium]|nr:tRNA (adenosine(37)-N6)-dimethylallyltransferase MiaA [Lachnospiraceae bacterium]